MLLTKDLYSSSISLLTDLYQITMAYGYWKSGKGEQEAVFNMFFRKNPFGGGYAIACGLEYLVDFLENFKMSEEDIRYLATLKGNDDQPLFEKEFLDYLANMQFTCSVEAIPEGTVVFPHEPLIRITGPIIQCQLIETPLLNIVNFQTLLATKAARVVSAAKGDSVLEFGLRRAQGIDGGVAASRATYIGGCDATSNVLAGKLFDIPVKGTHAHSWVMSFDSELEAFEQYAKVMPNNCIFLVDTFDTLEGVRHAIEVGKKLQAKGHKMGGIRLDSGDLAYLSIEARKILDEAGFEEAKIVASSNLDEYTIESLKVQDAQIEVWGIGTKMVTAYDQPALGGVYKLAAVKDQDQWVYKLKLSEQAIKISNPGIQQVRRYFNDDRTLAIADMIYTIDRPIPEDKIKIVDPMDMTRRKKVSSDAPFEDLLVPVFDQGKKLYQLPNIHDIRQRTLDQLELFHKGIRRFSNPHSYPVGLEKSLYDIKTDLILKLRGEDD